MTNTTDIKALSERMMQQREAALAGKEPSFEDCEQLVCDVLRALRLSISQLEVQRQRGDMLATQLDIAAERSGINFDRAIKAEQALVTEHWYLVSWDASSGTRGTTEVFFGLPWAKGDISLAIEIIERYNPDIRGVTISGVFPIAPPRQSAASITEDSK